MKTYVLPHGTHPLLNHKCHFHLDFACWQTMANSLVP